MREGRSRPSLSVAALLQPGRQTPAAMREGRSRPSLRYWNTGCAACFLRRNEGGAKPPLVVGMPAVSGIRNTAPQ